MKKITAFNVGQIKSEEAFGLIYEIGCQLVKQEQENKLPVYFIKLHTYSESDGQSCPNVKANSRAIFMVEGEKNIELKTIRDSFVQTSRPGLLAPSCLESNIEVGPLTKDLALRLTGQNELKFRIYGSRFSITGAIEKEDLKKMHEFLTQQKYN